MNSDSSSNTEAADVDSSFHCLGLVSRVEKRRVNGTVNAVAEIDGAVNRVAEISGKLGGVKRESEEERDKIERSEKFWRGGKNENPNFIVLKKEKKNFWRRYEIAAETYFWRQHMIVTAESICRRQKYVSAAT